MDAAERFRRSYFRRHPRRAPAPPRPVGVYRRDLALSGEHPLTVFEPILMTASDHLRAARWLEALANLHRVYALVEEPKR